MSQLKELLTEELQDLLSAESQIVAALPKMAAAAHHPKLKEAFEKHLVQTQGQIQRLRTSFELLGEESEAKTCRGMKGLIEEGSEKIEESGEKDEITSDLGLIAAAQKVEHYEIAAYGTARTLALQIEEREVAKLLSQTLGEEETSDHLLTEIAKPLLQQAAEALGERRPARKGANAATPSDGSKKASAQVGRR